MKEKDYLEQHPELAELSDDALQEHLEEAGAKAEAMWEAEQEERLLEQEGLL